jgi:hypothetical protein
VTFSLLGNGGLRPKEGLRKIVADGLLRCLIFVLQLRAVIERRWFVTRNCQFFKEIFSHTPLADYLLPNMRKLPGHFL